MSQNDSFYPAKNLNRTEVYRTRTPNQWNLSRRVPSRTAWNTSTLSASTLDSLFNVQTNPNEVLPGKQKSFYNQDLYNRMLTLNETPPIDDGKLEEEKVKASKKEFETRTVEKANGRWFVIEDSPKSMSILVKFYRIFGFSFTGLVIENDFDEDKIQNFDKESNEPKSDQIYAFRQVQCHPERYLFILANIVACMLQIFMLYTNNRNDLPQQIPLSDSIQNNTQMIDLNLEGENNSFLDWNKIEILASKLADNSKTIEMSQLKPIIRKIIESLSLVFVFDNFLSFAYNLIFGGHLVYKISQIMNIRQLDSDHLLAKHLICRSLLVIFLINVILAALFNSRQISWLYSTFFQVDKSAFRNDTASTDDYMNKKLNETEVTIFIIISRHLIHFLQYINLTLIPNLFIYSMQIFKKNIEKMQKSVETVKDLNEPSVMALKEKLTELNEQFKSIILCFSIPITISFASNTFMIIGSACFMMISQGQNQMILGFISNIGLLAFFRLVMISYAGNLPTNACRRLIRTIYEHLHEWELNEWICFMEMKQLRKEFVVSIFSTYRIRQASVLTMLGFALNYIVILLQTESSIDGNSESNFTSALITTNNITNNSLIVN